MEEEGLTTQQWAVLGALSRPQAGAGMSIGDLARYLMVSRQNLSGLIGRMERDSHVAVLPGEHDRRSRVVRMTDSGRRVWVERAQPKIRAYYEEVLGDFSINDMSHTLHYLLKMLGSMERLDHRHESGSGHEESGREPAGQDDAGAAGRDAGRDAGGGADGDADAGEAAGRG